MAARPCVTIITARRRRATAAAPRPLASARIPSIRTHEDTHKKAIYVNRLMTVGIVDMPPEESEPLLNAVFDHAEKRDFVYEHVWRVGNLLWDNRCSSHARTDFPRPTPVDAAHHGQGTVRASEYIAPVDPHRKGAARRSGCGGGRNDRPARTNGLRSRRRPGRDLAGGGAGLSPKSRSNSWCRSLPQHHRQHRPAHGPAPLRKLGPDRSGQQSRRRREHDRDQRGRQGATNGTPFSSRRSALRSIQAFRNCPTIPSGILPPSPSWPRFRSCWWCTRRCRRTNLQEFIALAKSKPGGWDYASSGTGTSPHLAAEMFKSMAGIELVHGRSKATPRP